MRDLGLLGRGMIADPGELDDGLTILNNLLDGWSLDNLVIPSVTSEDLSITAQQQSYTIGTGADFNTTRPLEIIDAYLFDGDNDYQLFTMTREQYNSIINKATGGLPDRYLYEPSYPNGVIYFDLQPTTNYSLHLDSLKPLTNFATLQTNIDFPPGYSRALRSNLAIDLAGSFGRGSSVPQTVVAVAASSKAAIEVRTAAYRVPQLRVDGGITGRSRRKYSINADS